MNRTKILYLIIAILNLSTINKNSNKEYLYKIINNIKLQKTTYAKIEINNNNNITYADIFYKSPNKYCIKMKGNENIEIINNGKFLYNINHMDKEITIENINDKFEDKLPFINIINNIKNNSKIEKINKFIYKIIPKEQNEIKYIFIHINNNKIYKYTQILNNGEKYIINLKKILYNIDIENKFEFNKDVFLTKKYIITEI